MPQAGHRLRACHGVSPGAGGWLRALLAACVPRGERGGRGIHLRGLRAAPGDKLAAQRERAAPDLQEAQVRGRWCLLCRAERVLDADVLRAEALQLPRPAFRGRVCLLGLVAPRCWCASTSRAWTSTCEVLACIDKQSPDITGGVHVGKDVLDVGAGDQGIMFG